MPLWGNRDQYSDAPKFVVDAASGDTGQEQFGNTVFMADTSETAVTKGIANPGWVRRVAGTGYVSSFVVNSGGTGYKNTDTISVSGGAVNATGAVLTNGNGVITAVTVTSAGSGFVDTDDATVAITSANGATANVSVTLGGRAGRVHFESLVTISGTVQGDAVSFSNTSTANVANSSGSADDSILPDA